MKRMPYCGYGMVMSDGTDEHEVGFVHRAQRSLAIRVTVWSAGQGVKAKRYADIRHVRSFNEPNADALFDVEKSARDSLTERDRAAMDSCACRAMERGGLAPCPSCVSAWKRYREEFGRVSKGVKTEMRWKRLRKGISVAEEDWPYLMEILRRVGEEFLKSRMVSCAGADADDALKVAKPPGRDGSEQFGIEEEDDAP